MREAETALARRSFRPVEQNDDQGDVAEQVLDGGIPRRSDPPEPRPQGEPEQDEQQHIRHAIAAEDLLEHMSDEKQKPTPRHE